MIEAQEISKTPPRTPWLNESELYKCVHCGFCNATCPTYQLLGDELDGPRGRIYLMKGMLEGHDVSRVTQRHLDRCLTCRACETTCPSGVRYGRLLEIGRSLIEREKTRSWLDRLMRMLLRNILSSENIFRFLFGFGQILRPVLPRALAQNIPAVEVGQSSSTGTHSRRMLLLAGCVQPTLAPLINSSAKEFCPIASNCPQLHVPAIQIGSFNSACIELISFLSSLIISNFSCAH